MRLRNIKNYYKLIRKAPPPQKKVGGQIEKGAKDIPTRELTHVLIQTSLTGNQGIANQVHNEKSLYLSGWKKLRSPIILYIAEDADHEDFSYITSGNVNRYNHHGKHFAPILLILNKCS